MQVADLIRRRKCSCPAEMVNTLLVLKLKDADPHSVSKGRYMSNVYTGPILPAGM